MQAGSRFQITFYHSRNLTSTRHKMGSQKCLFNKWNKARQQEKKGEEQALSRLLRKGKSQEVLLGQVSVSADI